MAQLAPIEALQFSQNISCGFSQRAAYRAMCELNSAIPPVAEFTGH
jgi:hypothetical protein